MTIPSALLVGKMAMHTEKADETMLHHAHVAIHNRQYGTEGQRPASEYSHLNRLKATQFHLVAALSRLLKRCLRTSTLVFKLSEQPTGNHGSGKINRK